MALKSDGTVWAWGRNTYGQLGIGSTTEKKTPIQLGSLSGVIAIAAGTFHSIALKSDGTVWAWGVNKYGQLGDNTTTTRLSPVQVINTTGGGFTGIMAIAAGGWHNLVIKTDNTVWTWGLNDNGQLGINSITNKLTPVKVTTLINIDAIAAGKYHSAAHRSDCTVWTWGQNTNGQVGDGTTTMRKVPVEVLNVIDAISVGAGNYHTAEINTDCTMQAWGDNSEGQIGDNTIIDKPTAVEVIIPPATPFDLGSCVFSDRDNDGIPDGCDNCPDNCNVNSWMQMTMAQEMCAIKTLVAEAADNLNVSSSANIGDHH